MSLHVPAVAGLDMLAAALAYAAAGWYIVPIRRGTKHPGSVLGDDWQTQSSRDPHQIASWYAGTTHGCALHVGRSGAVAFDGDRPEHLPGTILLDAIVACQPPQQRTREGRCHWLFLQPEGRMVGNGGAGAWGDVRGANGIIVVEPSLHPDDGHYQWLRIGDVPAMPAELAATLPDAAPGESPATGAQVQQFVDAHRDCSDPELLDVALAMIERDLPDEARHPLFTRWAATVMREAAAGLYPAADACEALRSRFVAAEGQGDGRVRTATEQAKEWEGILSWAIGQAMAADPDETRERVADMTGPPLTLNGHPKGEQSAPPGEEPLPGLLREVAKLDLRTAAVRYIAERDAAASWKGFDLGTSDQILARPDEPAARVADLIGWEASTLISAQRKTGKTTLVLNLARCLVLGLPFLGRPVQAVAGRVALLNFEVSARQIARWAADAGVPSDALLLVNTRGRGNPFASDHALDQLALALDGVECLIVDPFGAAFTGDDENNAGQARRWLSRLEQFARERVGALDLVLTAHAGKVRDGGTRGSSVLEDWPDTVIRMAVDDGGDRSISAIGRDVDLPPHELRYTSLTRTLTLGDPVEAAKARREATQLISTAVEAVEQWPGTSTNKLLRLLADSGQGVGRNGFLAALKQAAANGLIRVDAGTRGSANVYWPRVPQ